MLIYFIIIICIEIKEVVNYITFQKGSSDSFNYNPDSLSVLDTLKAGRTQSIQYSFPTPFGRVPYVYLVITQNIQQNAFPVGYYLDINSITKEGFTVTVTVPHTNRYYGIIFNWYAFDDSRRIVISAFNYQNPQPSYTFSHSNSHFTKAIVSLVSFVSIGYLNVHVQIDSITQNSVTASVSANSMLTYVGFQILIGIEEAFSFSPLGWLIKEYSIIFPGWEIGEYMITLEGMAWDGKANLRFMSTVTITDSDLTLQTSTWDNSYFDDMYLQQCNFPGQWEPQPANKPIFYYDYFYQQISDEQNKLTTQLYVVQLSQTLKASQGQTFNLEAQNITELRIEIIAKCVGTELWEIKILKCLDQYNIFNIQCSLEEPFKSHKHIVVFRQSEQLDISLTVVIKENLIQITQNIIDSQYNILELKY